MNVNTANYEKISNTFNFNHRIELQKETQTSGDIGEILSQYTTIKSVWGNISPCGAEKNYNRLKDDLEFSHTITIRYFEEAKQTKRILFGDRVFNVVSIICPNEEKKLLVITAKELEVKLKEEENNDNNDNNDNENDNENNG